MGVTDIARTMDTGIYTTPANRVEAITRDGKRVSAMKENAHWIGFASEDWSEVAPFVDANDPATVALAKCSSGVALLLC
jgi:hypothetical protein